MSRQIQVANIEMQNQNYKSQPDCADINHIPGDYGWPVIGKVPELVKDTKGLVLDHVKKYGPLSRVKIGPHKALLITDPNDLQDIFLDPKRKYSTRMGYSSIIGFFYDGCILFFDWEEHKIQRRILQASFKNQAMKGYVDLSNPIISQRLENLDKIENFLFYPHIKLTLLDIAAKVFLGLEELGEESKKVSIAFLDIAERGMTAIIRREIPGLPFLGFARAKQGQRYVEAMIKKLIPVRRAGNGNDLMSLVVKEKDDNGDYWSDEVLIPHLSFLWFASHDTTTSAMMHLVMYLAMPENHHFQERLRAFSRSLNKEQLDYDDLEKMQDLDNCFMEALRLNPSIILVPRRTIRDCEIQGYRVPAHTRLLLAPQFAHFDPSIWSNPDIFDPDRFLPERAEHKNHSFAFVGFGGGAHKCIGMHFAKMQGKMFLHQMLLKYKFTVPENYAPKMKSVPLPKPGDDLPLIISRL